MKAHPLQIFLETQDKGSSNDGSGILFEMEYYYFILSLEWLIVYFVHFRI